MGFYDDASLIFLAGAEAGKDGKAYSIKPTNGDGDFTFSRGSNLAATRVGADGLIEKGRENLLTYSNQFDTTWNLQSGLTLTSGQSGYDGSSDAWLLKRTASGAQFMSQNKSVSGVNTYSVYAKAESGSWMFLIGTASGYPEAYFDLSNGVIGNTAGSSIIEANIESVGNGWYRCSIIFNDSLSQFRIYPTDGNASPNGTTEGIYIQDAQLEIGLAATDVIESGATTGKAGLLEDEPRFDYSGGATCPSLLLEPSRTNLVEYSEYFGDSSWLKARSSVSINSDSNSVEGVKNSYKLFDSTDNGTHIVYNSFSQTIGQVQCFSVFAKQGNLSKMMLAFEDNDNASAIFDLTNGTATKGLNITTATATLIGDGWYRCSIVFTSLASTGFVRIGVIEGTSRSYLGTGNGSILIYGAQVESNVSYPTSYIPNHSGGSVTRGAETNIVEGISSVIGQTEGTLYGEVKFFDTSIDSIISLSAGTNDDRILFIKKPNNKYVLYVQATTAQLNLTTTGTFALSDYHKFAVTYKANDFKLYVDGTLELSATSGSVPVGMSQLEFYNPSGSAPFEGNVKQTLVFPEALSDADCITLTTL